MEKELQDNQSTSMNSEEIEESGQVFICNNRTIESLDLPCFESIGMEFFVRNPDIDDRVDPKAFMR